MIIYLKDAAFDREEFVCAYPTRSKTPNGEFNVQIVLKNDVILYSVVTYKELIEKLQWKGA